MSFAREEIHRIRKDKQRAFALKLDLSKAYDQVGCIFVRLLLIKNSSSSGSSGIDYGMSAIHLFYCFNKWISIQFLPSLKRFKAGMYPLSLYLSISCRSTKQDNTHCKGKRYDTHHCFHLTGRSELELQLPHKELCLHSHIQQSYLGLCFHKPWLEYPTCLNLQE